MRTVEKLLKELQEIPGDTLTNEASHLKPLLRRVVETCTDYMKMMTAVELH